LCSEGDEKSSNVNDDDVHDDNSADDNEARTVEAIGNCYYYYS